MLKIFSEEKKFGLFNINKYKQFQKKSDKIKNFLNFLISKKNIGKSLWIWSCRKKIL